MANVLLVDDNIALLKVQSRVLQLAGYTVTTATNGKEAMHCVQIQRFDLVVTDLIMPEKEGIETIMELRSKLPTLGIIAMTGGGPTGAEDYLRLARQLGASRTLAKPFSGKELIEAVNSALSDPN